MSPLKCYSCSTVISEIIQYCPNCSARIIHNTDLENIDVKELWLSAYKSHYKSGNNMLIDAVNMYAYIIMHFPSSEEAGYARNQLSIIGVDFSATPDGKVVISERSSDQQKSGSSAGSAVSEEVAALCNLLQIPVQSTPAVIAAKYAKMIEAWNPDRYISEPDKFFEAKQITERLEKAYTEANKFIEFSKVVPLPDDQAKEVVTSTTTTYPATTNAANGNTSYLFYGVTIVMVILIGCIGYIFIIAGNSGLGSPQYRGNLEMFMADGRSKGETVANLAKVLFFVFGAWIVLMIKKVLAK